MLPLSCRLAAVGLALALAGCTANTLLPPEQPNAVFAPWTAEPAIYQVGIADDLEIKFGFNAEFNDRVIVGPDGRFTMTLIGSVQAAGRTVDDITAELEQRFSRDLRRPRVQVLIRGYGSQRIFVGGEVSNPGSYAMPRPVGILEGILMANGFRDTARTSEVVLIRRRSDNKPMLRTVDLTNFVAGTEDDIPLTGADIIFVPKSTIAEVDLFVEQFITRVVPFERNFNYTLGSQATTTTTTTH
jgi:protein involved in polysaccharide export with SLBB domain